VVYVDVENATSLVNDEEEQEEDDNLGVRVRRLRDGKPRMRVTSSDA